MNRFTLALIATLFSVSQAQADNGIIRLQSSHDVSTTMDRLESAARNKGLTIFTRINHAKNAENAALALRPTELLILGNPKAGTPLMQCGQGIALDLPQKVAVLEDEEGAVWLSYNDPAYLAERHAVNGCQEVISRIGELLGNLARTATIP